MPYWLGETRIDVNVPENNNNANKQCFINKSITLHVEISNDLHLALYSLLWFSKSTQVELYKLRRINLYNKAKTWNNLRQDIVEMYR